MIFRRIPGYFLIIMNLLRDDLKKLYFSFLVPTLTAAVVFSLYSVVDTLAIGRGVGAIGSAANSVTLSLFCVEAFIGLVSGVGGSVLISKSKGEGETEKADFYFTVSLILFFVSTVLIWFVMWIYKEKFLRFFGADDNILPYALAYSVPMIAAYPLFILNNYLIPIILNSNSPRTVMIGSFTAAAINIAGDYLFVFPLRMGMFGAGLATALGAVGQTAVFLSFIISGKSGLRIVWPKHLLRSMAKVVACGFSSGVTEISIMIIALIANNQIMKYGDINELAVYGMLSTVASLIICIYRGIGESIQPVCSTNLGAGATDRCRKMFTHGLSDIILTAVLFTAVLEVLPGEVTQLFIKGDDELYELSKPIIRIYSASLFAAGINIYVSLYLQSVLKVFYATVISVLRGIVLISVLLTMLPLKYGISGIWYSFVATEWIVLSVSVFFFCKARG